MASRFSITSIVPVLVLLGVASLAGAEPAGPPAPKDYRRAFYAPKHRVNWKSSVGITVTGAAWDVTTSAIAWSRGGVEVHPWMRGHEGDLGRLLLIDGAAAAVFAGLDMILQRWLPSFRWVLRGFYGFSVGRVGLANLNAPVIEVKP